MKVLFLDIDGVLNCAKTFEDHHRHDAIDDQMVALINNVVDQTDCKIVISSSWRCLWQFDELVGVLQTHGLRDAVIDVTPQLKRRDEEILAWLANHPEVTQFAAIDDDSFDMTDIADQLVQTSFMTGTLPDHAEQLITLLSATK